MFGWYHLFVLELKLKFGEFGKYNRYRRRCFEDKAQTVADFVRIAQGVLDGPGVGVMEAKSNEDFLRNHGG